MKSLHAAALALVGLVLAGCAGRDSWNSDYAIGSILHPQIIAARKKHLDTLRKQMSGGPLSARLPVQIHGHGAIRSLASL
jgi:hypothetical protein